MGVISYLKGTLLATWTGLSHLLHPRMTLKYPEQKMDLEYAGYPTSPRRPAGLSPGYKYDPVQGVGIAGFKGRHILYFERCTGCQLCAIACDGVAVAIDMQKVQKGKPQNKKDVWPAVDYGRCVPPSTPITTMDGIKPLSEIRVGDRVLTHTGRFRGVTRLFSRRYTGKLYTFKTRGNPEPLTTTEDHPILVFDEGELTWSFANEIELGTFLTRPMLPSQLSDKLGPDSSLYQGSAVRRSSGTKGSLLELKQIRDETVMSEIISIETSDVNDFLVQNLEVEEDNSYVAANQSVHNCVFCGLCLDPDTPVITNPGVKPLSAIAVGDMLLTHTGEYKPVTRIWDMRYTGPLYRIYVYGKPEPLVCTKDHRILAVSRPRGNRADGRPVRSTEPLLMTLPENLKVGDYLVNPIVKKVKSFDKYEADIPFGRSGRTKHIVLEASLDLFRLIGYYISEGSHARSAVRFSLHKEEIELIGDIKSLSEKFFGKTPSLVKATGGVNVVLHSAIAARFFSQFGTGAEDKKVADWVFHSEKAKLAQLLKGIWLGDGRKINQPRQKHLNFRTSSEVLAFQEQSILARLGIVGLVEREDREDRLTSYRISVLGRWALRLANVWNIGLDYHPSKFVDKFHLTEDYVFLPIRRIECADVSHHRVMDVTVEDVHTFAPIGLATANCVDACPFDALYMTDDYELSAYDKMGLKYTPDMLSVPPKLEGKKYKVKLDTETGEVRYG